MNGHDLDSFSGMGWEKLPENGSNEMIVAKSRLKGERHGVRYKRNFAVPGVLRRAVSGAAAGGLGRLKGM